MSRVTGHNARMQTLFIGHSVKPDTCQLSRALEPCTASGGRPAWADGLHGRSCTPGRGSTWPVPPAAPLAVTHHGHIATTYTALALLSRAHVLTYAGSMRAPCGRPA